MSATRFFFIIVLFMTAWLGTGCGGFNSAPTVTALPPVRLTQPPTFAPTVPPTASASATALMPSPTAVDPALQTVEDFFAALEAGNYESAAGLYSNFSLMVDEITRGEAAAQLKSQAARGEKISAGQVLESRAFDERTRLVRVRYLRGSQETANDVPGTAITATATGTQPPPEPATLVPTVTLASGSVDQTRQAEMIRDVTATALAKSTVTPFPPTPLASAGNGEQTSVDEWWPVRQESGQWRYNRGNLIDFQTLDVPVQTTAGLTVKPRQLTRYSDRLRLTLLVQNQTNEAIVLGQPNEVMATFLFGDQQVEADTTRLIFERLRSYPDTHIELAGMYESYPDGIIIRKWKNVQAAPWFVFVFE